MSRPPGPAGALGVADGLRYGSLGLPLAFVALPLYVVLPNHYATAFGVPLAALGAVLLGARLLDAVADPWIGRWIDALFALGARRVWHAAALASLALVCGFAALFFPPASLRGDPAWLLGWCALALTATCIAYSVAGVAHQAWGARLGGNPTQRARIVAWREGPALGGVLIASALPAVAGLDVMGIVFALLMLAGTAALRAAPHPVRSSTPSASIPLPLRNPAFRRLLVVYLVNGIASAIPATLVLFFIRDRLQAGAQEPLFLVAYFAAAAASIPIWVRCVARHGLVRSWLASMLLAVAVFIWAGVLGAGAIAAFLVVCLLSGLALGADLALPPALLAGVIRDAGHGDHAEGAYFGWWNCATKLNLALAAGLALPLLQWFDYRPGSHDAEGLLALSLAYAVLPCVLKLAAAALLWRSGLHTARSAESTVSPPAQRAM